MQDLSESSISDWEELRSILQSIAYHILGSVPEAEDVVQDVLLAYQRIKPETIQSPQAYLRTAVANRSLNRLKIMKREREFYPGTWLPTPIPSTSEHPILHDRQAHVSMGLLVLMEQLTPTERTVFVLREVFGWAYESISEIVQREEENCRQLLRRAKTKVRIPLQSSSLPKEQISDLSNAFQEAIESGNLDVLLNLLQEEVVFLSDGGGKVSAAVQPLIGKSTVRKFLIGIQKHLPLHGQIELGHFNETLGLVIRGDSGTIETIMTFGFDTSGRIESLYTVRNPRKLVHLQG